MNKVSVGPPLIGLVGIPDHVATSIVMRAIGHKKAVPHRWESVGKLLDDRNRPDLDLLVVSWPLMAGHGSIEGLGTTITTKAGILLDMDAKNEWIETGETYCYVKARLTSKSTYEELAKLIASMTRRGWPDHLCRKELIPARAPIRSWSSW